MKRILCIPSSCSVTLSLSASLFAVLLQAQPQPPDLCVVISEPGNANRPLSRAYEVKQQYRERVHYYNSDRFWLKPDSTITLQGGDLFKEKNEDWRVFTPITGVSESRLLVIAGADTMCIELPEDPSQLIARAWSRGDRDTPEVIRFRTGVYVAEELIGDPRAVATAGKLARRLDAEDEAVYKEELAALEGYYKNQPPPVAPTTPYTPPPPMNEQEWAAYWAEQPALRQVDVERVNADTVWLRISGRVMLDGGCASGMPFFGIEMRTGTGWEERLAMRQEQLCCGMPWGDWEEQVVMLHPLRWWVSVNSPAATKELLPGTYRIVLKGGNMQEMQSPSFDIP